MAIGSGCERAEATSFVGPYRILGLLGRGGMGVVCRGQHRETGEVVAVKTVRAPSAILLACIRREIHALSRLRHPGVARIVGEGLHEGMPYYAMELYEGETLRGQLDRVWSRGVHERFSGASLRPRGARNPRWGAGAERSGRAAIRAPPCHAVLGNCVPGARVRPGSWRGSAAPRARFPEGWYERSSRVEPRHRR